MWASILFLWSIPLALGLVMLARMADGAPPLSEEESRLWFGDAEMNLSVWMGVKFAALAVGFFLGGLFEGLVVSNFGLFWQIVVPLITGSGAILLLLQWVRSAPRHISHRVAAQTQASHRRPAGIFSR